MELLVLLSLYGRQLGRLSCGSARMGWKEWNEWTEGELKKN
jgi:hypothetical protein